jgi:hypothetical protein
MTPRLAGRAGALTLIAATTLALAGCGGVGAKLTYRDTEKTKVTNIVLDGKSGDITVRTAAIAETRITRVIRNSTDPKESYRLAGTTLYLDTRCGPDCNVSYEIEAPPGVAVRGSLTSGTVSLTNVGAADLEVTSGDILVRGATGAVQVKATSGDITVDDAKAGATLQATSGDLHAVNISGGPVSAKVTSGNVTVQLDAAASVTAQAGSGDVNVVVPAGSYQVRTQKGSGELKLAGVTDDASAKNILDLRVDSGNLTVATA